MPDTVQRAELTIDGAGTLPCLFNPGEYTMRKRNAFAAELQPGTSVPVLQYTGGRPAEMTVELLFDVTLSEPQVSSIVPDTKKLFLAMEPSSESGQPPNVLFKWGAMESFSAQLADLEVQYVLFSQDGSPVRAWARLTLMQSQPSSEYNPGAVQFTQNPTTRADGGGSSWIVRLGDSLPSIAYAKYGDQTAWRTIARANGIDNPFRLRTGTVLTIPTETTP